MKIFSVIKNIGLAAVTLGLGAGLAVLIGGCAASPRPDVGAGGSDHTQTGSRPPRPLMDVQAPTVFETASFGFG